MNLLHVPQFREDPVQKNTRMQWFRDAKFGMFIHWGPCTVDGKEIGWGRDANRPWDINRLGPRQEDPVYDNYYKQFNPDNYDPDAWVQTAQNAGMKYMVLVTKHHDGFCMFDTRSTPYNITATPYGKDIVEAFVKACHHHGMKVGLYYSTRDWWHPDYLVGDNKKYDAYYRGHVEELLSKYGKIDLMWFDHVGGQNWGKWDFEKLFEMMYRLQPHLIVNNRAAKFCGPATPEDTTAAPEIVKMTQGDYYTPENEIGKIDLENDWESCMVLSPTENNEGWSYRPEGKTRPVEECIRMLVSTATGGGNLLLNFAPKADGGFQDREIAVAEAMGAWTRRYADTIFGTRGGPLPNGAWGGTTRRGKAIYIFASQWQNDMIKLPPIKEKILSARLVLGGEELGAEGLMRAKGGDYVPCHQSAEGVELTVPAEKRETPFTVMAMMVE